jgi:hypothetical protein
MTIYALDPAETVLLIEACKTLDRIADMDAELARDGLTVRGGRGQGVVGE